MFSAIATSSPQSERWAKYPASRSTMPNTTRQTASSFAERSPSAGLTLDIGHCVTRLIQLGKQFQRGSDFYSKRRFWALLSCGSGEELYSLLTRFKASWARPKFLARDSEARYS